MWGTGGAFGRLGKDIHTDLGAGLVLRSLLKGSTITARNQYQTDREDRTYGRRRSSSDY